MFSYFLMKASVAADSVRTLPDSRLIRWGVFVLEPAKLREKWHDKEDDDNP